MARGRSGALFFPRLVMKQSKRLIWPFAVSMALAGKGPAAAPNFQELPLTAQSRSLPREFKDHFFDVPLAMRVEIDGQFLSDAMGVLTEAGRVQLIEWMRESGDSPQDATRWLQFLREPRALGACGGDCGDVVALHYNLQTSTLSIVTAQAERAGTVDRYHRLPAGGSRGLLLRNALNVAGGERQSLAARYTVDAIGSVGQWTSIGTVLGSQSALADGERRHLVSRLYLQRETHGHFIRAGFFVPDYQGRLRAPRAPDLSRPFMVSLHLPCYAEPPEVVMATMDSLAALDYPHFEVLVCDNNTQDESLWRPLQSYCAALNRRLRRAGTAGWCGARSRGWSRGSPRTRPPTPAGSRAGRARRSRDRGDAATWGGAASG